MLKLDDQLCFALYAATNAVTRTYRPMLAALELTYPQYLVMLALWQHGAAPVSDLAMRLRVGASGITPLVDQLVKSGLVTRARSRVDRRLVAVLLTPAGVRLEEAAAEVQREVVCRTGLTDDAMAALRGELHDLVDRIATSADGGSAPPSEPD